MSECKKDKCALRLIYPKGDNATWACDDECYFSYCGKEKLELYIKGHPEKMKVCGLIEGKNR